MHAYTYVCGHVYRLAWVNDNSCVCSHVYSRVHSGTRVVHVLVNNDSHAAVQVCNHVDMHVHGRVHRHVCRRAYRHLNSEVSNVGWQEVVWRPMRFLGMHSSMS